MSTRIILRLSKFSTRMLKVLPAGARWKLLTVFSTMLCIAGMAVLAGAVSKAQRHRAKSVAPAVSGLQLQTTSTGLSNPLLVTNAHDGSNRLFIVEQPGTIQVLQPGATTPTLFLDISSKVQF